MFVRRLSIPPCSPHTPPRHASRFAQCAPTLPLQGYGMHTSDSLFVASGVKSVSHQSHLDRMWQFVIAHRGCLDNPLKKSRFLRCVNPLAPQGGGECAAVCADAWIHRWIGFCRRSSEYDWVQRSLRMLTRSPPPERCAAARCGEGAGVGVNAL